MYVYVYTYKETMKEEKHLTIGKNARVVYGVDSKEVLHMTVKNNMKEVNEWLERKKLKLVETIPLDSFVDRWKEDKE